MSLHRRGLALIVLGVWLACGVRPAGADPLGPPPGTLVPVGGRPMHLHCLGQGRPVVVFDAGLGGTSLEWQAVQRQVAAVTEACLYDRAGYGWSALRGKPRTAVQSVRELRALLEAAGRPGPYVLVGHSYGGLNLQLFARSHPAAIAGLVLVDASHPEQVERFLAPPYETRIAPSSRHGLVKFGARPSLHPALSRAALQVSTYQFAHWRARRAQAYEMLGFRDSTRAVRNAAPFPDVPLVVITRGRRSWAVGDKGDALEALWLNLQTELAAQSPRALHLVALHSGHLIHLDQPELVAFGIALVLQEWQRDAGLPELAVSRFSSLAAGAARWLSNTLPAAQAAASAAAALETGGQVPGR